MKWKMLIVLLLMQALATNVDAWEYKYNWQSREKDVSKRWEMTSTDAKLTYDWKSTNKDLGKRWSYVREDEAKTYNWKTSRWQYAPKKGCRR